MTRRSASLLAAKILFAFVLALVLQACGQVEPPTCEEISQTTYAISLANVDPREADAFRDAAWILARDLHTHIQEVPSCGGVPNCYTITARTLPPGQLALATMTGQIQLSPSLKRESDNVTLHVAMHEMVHQIRLDPFVGSDIHDTSGLMAPTVGDEAEPLYELTPHDLGYICQPSKVGG